MVGWLNTLNIPTKPGRTGRQSWPMDSIGRPIALKSSVAFQSEKNSKHEFYV